MSDGTTTMDPAEALARLGRIRLDETDIDGVLGTVAELARDSIANAAEVSVTLVDRDRPHTTASTGELALRLDEAQYEAGTGPCLDASAAATTLSLPDMAAETRWPGWAEQARRQGVGSSLSIGLPVLDEVTGALNVYATSPGAFPDEAVAVAESFADYAGAALANAHLYDSVTTLAGQMRAAMASRAVIEQAKGIIMGERRCSPDEAFAILAKLSQDTNRKLRDVAELLVDSAGKPRP